VRSSLPGYVLVKEQIPFYQKGMDNLLAYLGTVLKKEEYKYTQKISVEAGLPYIKVERFVSDQSNEIPAPLELHELIRHKIMEEFAEKKASPSEELKEMFDYIARQDMYGLYIFAENTMEFLKWIGIPLKRTQVFGAELISVPKLPEKVFLVCGASSRNAEPEDVEYLVLGRVP
jgi:hypothetical protein